MLHELLLALLGYTGDLIIDERERRESLCINLSPTAPLADEPTFKLAPDLSFIEPSDRYLLSFFCHVHYFAFTFFATSVEFSKLPPSPSICIEMWKIFLGGVLLWHCWIMMIVRKHIKMVITLGFQYCYLIVLS